MSASDPDAPLTEEERAAILFWLDPRRDCVNRGDRTPASILAAIEADHRVPSHRAAWRRHLARMDEP